MLELVRGASPPLVAVAVADPAARVELLLAGADDCMPAAYTSAELAARVIALGRWTRFDQPGRPGAILRAGPLQLDRAAHELRQLEVRRSSLVLQGLTFRPSSAVVAAATTSLPERLGGEDNYDYRFAWLRDLSLTIRALWVAACPAEPSLLFDWFANAAGHLGDELVQIMYGVEGERDLTEHELEHLSGYHGSRPVRVGNQAWRQQQLDVLGEVLDAAFLLRTELGTLDRPVRDMLVTLANRAADCWAEPDAGMWESRGKPRQYVSSKVMCWVALDRAIQLAPVLGPNADPTRWALARGEVHAAVLDQAWSRQAGAYAPGSAVPPRTPTIWVCSPRRPIPTAASCWATSRKRSHTLGLSTPRGVSRTPQPARLTSCARHRTAPGPCAARTTTAGYRSVAST